MGEVVNKTNNVFAKHSFACENERYQADCVWINGYVFSFKFL